MKHLSRIIAALLAVLFVAALLPGEFYPQVAAADAEQINRMNVVLVIDGSYSLISKNDASDPEGYRYDAIDLFLALLTERGNNVSTIVFNGKEEFLLDTGFQSLDSRESKLSLSEKIRAVSPVGRTNIGAALERAVEEAATKSKENGLSTVVILFSDGRTDMGSKSAYDDSLRSKETAVKKAQNEGIPIYTICLAVPGGDADPEELEEIAKRTNGKFEKVTNAEALSLEFETFYEMIFGATGAQIQQTVIADDGNLSIPVTIPSHGAEEVNVILDTRGLNNITISGPGIFYNTDEIEDISMHGGYYQVIKLVEPPCGDWSVELEGIPARNVTVNVLFNINSVAALTTKDGRTDYAAGEEVTFCATLVENGKTVLEPVVNVEYTAELILTNNTTGQQESPILMTSDGQGTFQYIMKGKDYGTYTATVNLICDNIVLTSNKLTVMFDNTAPVAKESKITVDKIVFMPFFGGEHTLDMTQYFSDGQDTSLKYRVVSAQLKDGTYDLNEGSGILEVDTAHCKSGEIVIEAVDSQFATAVTTVYFDIFDVTFWLWGTGVLVLMGVIALVIVLAVASNMHKWKGDICVSNLNGVRATPRTNFRGSLDLKVFNVGDTGIKGKFKAGSHNQIYLLTKKAVFTEHSASATKRILLRSGRTRIFTDVQHNRGIEVEITPEVNRRSGFGGFNGVQMKRGTSGNGGGNPGRPGNSF